jgi:hypothetical protein
MMPPRSSGAIVWRHRSAEDRTMKRHHRLAIHCIAGALGVLLAGCAATRHELAPRGDAVAAPMPEDPPGPIVGIAVSGGGSRAALFTAAVLQQLASLDAGEPGRSRSVLENVQYISSVSGGSLASAYYVMNKPGSGVAMLDHGQLTPDYKDFFGTKFLPDMRADWEEALFGAALGGSMRRADAIADRWDESLFAGATFAKLADRERRGDAPWLVLNGTSWESGRRMVFTTLPKKAFAYDFVQEVSRYLDKRGFSEADVEAMKRRIAPESRRFAPITFEDINVDPSTLHVSVAVASSSSVPLVLGPVTFAYGDGNGNSQTLHVGDGGMFDNQGIESLAQIMFPKLLKPENPGGRTGLLIVVDASYPFDGDPDLYQGSRDLVQMIEKSPARVSDIMEERAIAYQLLLWLSLRTPHETAGQIVPDADHLKIVYMRHVDAAGALAQAPPPECKDWPGAKPTEAQMRERLSRIPTRYKIENDCDAALLKASARWAVEANAKRILEGVRTK